MCEECTCGEHAKHATVPLKDVLEQHKASLQEQLDSVKNRCVDTHIYIINPSIFAKVPFFGRAVLSCHSDG